jgi:signal transduction histidine kinase
MRAMHTENRILLGVLVAWTFMVALAGGVLTAQINTQWKNANDLAEARISRLLSAGLGPLMMDGTGRSAHHFAQQVLAAHNNPGFRQLIVTPKEGNPWVNIPWQGKEPLTALQIEEGAKNGRMPNVNAPIFNVNTVKLTNGTAGLLLDNQRLLTEHQSGLTALWCWLVALWALVAAGMVWANMQINRQFNHVCSALQQLGQGNFGVVVPDVAWWNEAQNVTHALNDVSMQLKHQQDELTDILKAEKTKLQQVLLSIADGVVVCDTLGVVTLVNDAAVAMLGLRHYSNLVGSCLTEFMTVNGEKPFEQCVTTFLKNPMAESIEPWTIALMNARFRVIISPVAEQTGLGDGAVLIMHDVTREMEIDTLKTRFISNVSHELRTPVTTIKTYVDTLSQHGDTLPPETYQEFMDTLTTETDRLKRLVNDVLEVGHLQEGAKLPLAPEEVGPIMHLTVQSMKVLAEKKQLTISTNIETNLPLVLINADSIERVIRNLLSNAIKYTKPGGRIRCKTELTDGGKAIIVAVEDNGIGIASEHLPHIFDRFYRVEHAVHTVKGTGLGLHLVKMTIEDYHQGNVFVESTPGKGSVFGFTLPVVQRLTSASITTDPNSLDIEEAVGTL